MSIKALLTRILDRIGSESFVLTLGTENGYGYGIYDKSTKTVRIYFWAGATNNTITASTTMFTIPVGYRPSSQKAGVCWLFTTQNTRGFTYLFNINTDGTLKQGFSNYVDRIIGIAEYTL